MIRRDAAEAEMIGFVARIDAAIGLRVAATIGRTAGAESER
jgi:hypothetical protein